MLINCHSNSVSCSIQAQAHTKDVKVKLHLAHSVRDGQLAEINLKSY